MVPSNGAFFRQRSMSQPSAMAFAYERGAIGAGSNSCFSQRVKRDHVGAFSGPSKIELRPKGLGCNKFQSSAAPQSFQKFSCRTAHGKLRPFDCGFNESETQE
jgi:hypothetical protein